MNPYVMTMMLKVQYFIIISICLHWELSYGFPYHGVEMITYGEPCYSPHYLPVKIEKPHVEKCILAKPYQPLKLNYRISEPLSQREYIHTRYPVVVEVPKVAPLEIGLTDFLRGKSYEYSIQTSAPPPAPIAHHNFDLQVLPPHPKLTTPEKPIKYLTGLTSKIDKVLVPACERPSCSCKIYAA